MGSTPRKKLVVLDHGGGRMANQLWNDAAIYAYSLERGFDFESWASFEYRGHFLIPPVRNLFVRFAFFNPLVVGRKLRRIIKKTAYSLFAKTVKYFRAADTLVVGENIFLLPPSEMPDKAYSERLSRIESSGSKNMYFFGWLFANPSGLKKFRDRVVNYFKPKAATEKRVLEFMSPLKNKFKHIVGVHFRQGDYKQPIARDNFYFSEEEVRDILDAYLAFFGNEKDRTLFLIASDEPFRESAFAGLQIAKCPGGEMEDLLALSQTDIIIGSKSTYGEFAAYYGNLPFVVFERGGVEWDYYKGRTEYFENKKAHLSAWRNEISSAI